MLKFDLHFKYNSMFYDSCEDSVIVTVNTINEAIDEIEYHLEEFNNQVYYQNFDDDELQRWEYNEDPRKMGENIHVTLSFNGKCKHFRNAYTFMSYINKYFRDEMEAL